MRWADDSVPRVLWAGALDGVAMPSLRKRYASAMATGRKEFKGRLTKILAFTHESPGICGPEGVINHGRGEKEEMRASRL